MMTLKELRERKQELDERIASYPYWGAALTAMNEERNGIAASIRSLEQRQHEQRSDD